MRIIALLIALLASAGNANAKDYGRWLCVDCSIDTLPTGQPIPPAGELRVFIVADVNPAIGGPSMWKAYDTITICNGGKCIPLVYHAGGNHLPLGPPYFDNRSGYKNMAAGAAFPAGVPSGSSLAGAGFQYNIEGHWVNVYMVTHHSGNSVLVDRFFEITSITLMVSSIPDPYYTAPQ